MVKISAPGKIHLIGEHSAVYGEPAIISAINLRCFVNAEKGDKEIIVKIPEINLEEFLIYEEAITFSEQVKKLWKECYDIQDFSELFRLMKKDPMNQIKATVGEILKELYIGTGIQLEINSEIPIGTGLGSSAALSVAITKAVAETYGQKTDKDEINRIAFGVEKYMHGMPSGGDNSACCYGGIIWFQKGNPNTIDPITIGFDSLKDFILVNTGKPHKSTGELIQHIRNLNENFRNSRIKALGQASYAMKDALHSMDMGKVKGLMNFAQRNLKELGVSTDKIDEIHEEVLKIGGAAKLSGAGGGGIVLCYHENKKKLEDKIVSLGLDPLPVNLAAEGVRVEK